MGVQDVIVIGAGVSGLTSALCIARTGRRVRVVSREMLDDTTSGAAGASWAPYLVEDPRVLAWSKTTWKIFEELAAEPESGVRFRDGVEAADSDFEPPDWAREINGFRMCTDAELAALPRRYTLAWRYQIPLIDMPTYLRYLTRRLHEAGVPIEHRTITSFEELRSEASAIVNCTGLGSRALVPDPELTAVRGQIVVVENPGIEEFFQDNTHLGDLTYIVPHGDRVVLGGSATTSEQGLSPNRQVTREIIQRCADVVPSLAQARIIQERVGLRPTRKGVRVEIDPASSPRLIHNYGHGGAGVTLSWGCALEVCELLAV